MLAGSRLRRDWRDGRLAKPPLSLDTGRGRGYNEADFKRKEERPMAKNQETAAPAAEMDR